MLLIKQRYTRGFLTKAGNDLFLKLVLDEFDALRLAKNAVVPLVSDEHDGSYRILSAIRCPGGEAEAWVLLRRIGSLPTDHIPAAEARISYAVRFDRAPTLSA